MLTGMEASIIPFLDLVVDQGLPTLMPLWQNLENSSVPKPLADEHDSAVEDSTRVAGGLRTLVLIHAFDPERLPTLLKRIKFLPLLHDLVITTDTKSKALRVEAIHKEILGDGLWLRVEVVANHGRDVLPFWTMLRKYGSGYDYFLKLHLKRTIHWDNFANSSGESFGSDAGAEWTNDSLRCLIPASNMACLSLLHWMSAQHLGCLYPRPYGVVARYGWGAELNFRIAASILRDFGSDEASLLAPLIFPAGNMFWGSICHFSRLIEYFSEDDRYPEEPLPTDGTFLHATERCLSFLMASKGVNVGILFPPVKGNDHSNSLRTLSLDLVSLTFGSGLSCLREDSSAYRLYNIFIGLIVDARDSERQIRIERDSLQQQVIFLSRSRLRHVLNRARNVLRGLRVSLTRLKEILVH